VVVPGLGADIQAIKAGILEVADLFCVNKADREGADRTVRDLRQMMELSSHDREVAIVKCVASLGEGIVELWDAVEAHYRLLKAGPGLLQRETQRARFELIEILRDRMLRAALERLSAQGAHIDELALRIARRDLDPYSVAEEAARG
jgi:LAO/AO transport system kinase